MGLSTDTVLNYNAECIVAEWLYRKNLDTNRTVTIFERTTESAEFGATVRKECDAYKEQIPPETLTLSFFNKLKLKTDIFRDVLFRNYGYISCSCRFFVKTPEFWMIFLPL